MTSTTRTLGIVLAGILFLGGAFTVSAQTMTKEQQLAALQAHLAALLAGRSNAAFSADLSVSSTGSEVTRLQNFLIDRGYTIPAGATGYFGEQTRSALARFQGAQGIASTAGYFGPITRTGVNVMLAATIPTTPPSPVPDNDEVDENDAEDAIDDLRDSIADAQDDIDAAEDDGDDVDDANDLLDEARDFLDVAEEAFDDEDFDEVMDRVEDAEDRIDDALDESANDDETDVVSNDSSARTQVVGGEDNDYAVFEIEVEVEAFNQDVFISQNGTVAFTYRIENASNGSVVGAGTTETATVSSTADTSGNYYRVNEDDTETFTFTVTFNPQPGDEGESYRLQLLTIEFDEDASAPDQTWNASPASDYETPSTYVND